MTFRTNTQTEHRHAIRGALTEHEIFTIKCALEKAVASDTGHMVTAQLMNEHKLAAAFQDQIVAYSRLITLYFD